MELSRERQFDDKGSTILKNSKLKRCFRYHEQTLNNVGNFRNSVFDNFFETISKIMGLEFLCIMLIFSTNLYKQIIFHSFIMKVVGIILVFFLLSINVVSAYINVDLISPENGNVSADNSITFVCSATSSDYVKSIALYHNINGNFSWHSVKCFGEICHEEGDVLLMHFNNDSVYGENETHVYDFSGNGNNGTVHGAVYNSSAGKFFGAFEFDGASSYIEIPDSDSLDITAGTIEVWLKADTLGLAWKPVITKEYACDTSPYALWIYDNKPVLALNSWDQYVSGNTPMETDKWYHVVATWNGSDIKIYLNGTLDVSESQLTTVFTNSEALRIGTAGPDCDYWFDGIIDEVVIYNRTLTAEEVLEHYNSVLTNAASANWTIGNISDGVYVWNCLAYDNYSQSNWSSQNYTFYIDSSTPPYISSIVLTPSSPDDIDPGITINITVNATDPSGVDTAIFQYRWESTSWKNITMNYLGSSLWNASFTVPYDGTYYYRVWSNDSLGHSDYSQIYNISVEWDYSWTASPETFGERFIFFGKNESIGVLVINNTGDYPLIFKLSSTFANTFFNMSEIELQPKEVAYVNITVTSPLDPGEYPVQIIINATTENAEPQEKRINFTIISYWGGPYLTASIVKYETIVQQSTSGINYSVKVRNIGNETATGVWINWSLPEGWSVVSGNLTLFVGNLTNGSFAWNNITVSLSSNARAGVVYLYVYSGSSNNATANASIQVSVICSNTDGVCGAGCSYMNDDDCPIPSGGGEITIVSGGGIKIVEYKMLLSAPKRIDVIRGKWKEIGIEVSNPVDGVILSSVKLKVSGHPQTLTRIYPESFNLSAGEKKMFYVNISVPEYMPYGKKELIFLAKADASFVYGKNITVITNSSRISMIVHSVWENLTQKLILDAHEAVEKMKKMGINTKEFENLVKKAEGYINESRYEEAKDVLEEVMEKHRKAELIESMLEDVEEGINIAKKYWISLPETESLYSLALSAFERGDLSRAEKRVKDALLVYATEGGIINVLIFIHRNWLLITFLLFLGTGIGYVAIRRVRIILIKIKLSMLRREEKIIENLIRKAQIERFKKMILSDEEYRNLISHYEDRMVKIKRESIEIQKIVDSLK